MCLTLALCILLCRDGGGGASQQQPSSGLFGEAMVVTPRGDSVKVPFFKDSLAEDTVWVVPLVVFWQVVLQDPIMPKRTWKIETQVHSSREATQEELGKLQRQMYLSTSTTQELMTPLDGLIDCLEDLALRINTIEATVKSQPRPLCAQEEQEALPPLCPAPACCLGVVQDLLLCLACANA